MSEDEVQQTGETPEADISSEDAEVAGTVDQRADELSDAGPSPQPAGIDGDPIGEAESHIASLDMNAEREKVAKLQKKL